MCLISSQTCSSLETPQSLMHVNISKSRRQRKVCEYAGKFFFFWCIGAGCLHEIISAVAQWYFQVRCSLTLLLACNITPWPFRLLHELKKALEEENLYLICHTYNVRWPLHGDPPWGVVGSEHAAPSEQSGVQYCSRILLGLKPPSISDRADAPTKSKPSCSLCSLLVSVRLWLSEVFLNFAGVIKYFKDRTCSCFQTFDFPTLQRCLSISGCPNTFGSSLCYNDATPCFQDASRSRMIPYYFFSLISHLWIHSVKGKKGRKWLKSYNSWDKSILLVSFFCDQFFFHHNLNKILWTFYLLWHEASCRPSKLF